jgi:hypothetical protein
MDWRTNSRQLGPSMEAPTPLRGALVVNSCPSLLVSKHLSSFTSLHVCFPLFIWLFGLKSFLVDFKSFLTMHLCQQRNLRRLMVFTVYPEGIFLQLALAEAGGQWLSFLCLVHVC